MDSLIQFNTYVIITEEINNKQILFCNCFIFFVIVIVIVIVIVNEILIVIVIVIVINFYDAMYHEIEIIFI